MNQAALEPLVVPVLPATCRPMPALRPVPLSTTPRSTWLTVSAMAGSIAWTQSGAGIGISPPRLSVILVMARGGQYRPRAANVA
jgi:hypothetical protein